MMQTDGVGRVGNKQDVTAILSNSCPINLRNLSTRVAGTHEALAIGHKATQERNTHLANLDLLEQLLACLESEIAITIGEHNVSITMALQELFVFGVEAHGM